MLAYYFVHLLIIIYAITLFLGETNMNDQFISYFCLMVVVLSLLRLSIGRMLIKWLGIFGILYALSCSEMPNLGGII